MKERIFYDDDDFEKQLKSKADQFKMYPSDRVWNEVHSSLHGKRRKFVVGMSMLIGSILILAGSQLIIPSKNIPVKPVALKSETPVKTVADIQKLTADNFTSVRKDKSTDPREERITPAKVPFLNNQPTITVNLNITESQLNSITLQESPKAKPVTYSDPGVSEKSNLALVAAPAISDNNWTIPEKTRQSELSADLNAADKSITRLNHLRNDRFSWEIYVAPTLNSHYLNGFDYQAINQSVQQQGPIMLVGVSNVNGFVDNTPLVGYDVGGNLYYKLSKNISLKAGLAFSFNRYYIKAYNSNPYQIGAQLNSYLGYIADSAVATVGNPNANHKNPEHIQNHYYQLSMPVGVDMKIAGRNRVQLHLGATIQPSYLLSTDAYVLSDDYHTYVKDDQAFRKWNLFAGGELYLSYSVGKIRWELGPQLRYQILSTYKSSYPLQENMMSYGLRFGISKTIW